VIALEAVAGNLVDAMAPRVRALKTGDQLDPDTQMGPMIRESDAARVEEWIGEAVRQGARLVTGGKRQGALHEPTLLAGVLPHMRVSREELFGPAVAVSSASSLEDAIAQANDTNYGLSAAIFTRDIQRALRFARDVDAGNLHINWGPQWRADLMPYGGLKESGFGKEGPKYAVQEMTELKTVVIHGAWPTPG
jgi:acyl-CoA reductase-like NAD-dependent aldehyde dehydrogenase